MKNTINNTEDLSPVEIDTILSDLWSKEATVRGYRSKDAKRLRRLEAGERVFETAEVIEARIVKFDASIDELKLEAAPYEAEFERRGRWSRYFLVTNGNGHIHQGTNCSTCRPTTAFAWLLDLADCDVPAMVDAHGIKACTVCFPSAPTLPGWKRGEQAAAKAEAEKAASKCAGGGKYVEGWNYRSRYSRCPDCNVPTSITSTGKLRAHKPGK